MGANTPYLPKIDWDREYGNYMKSEEWATKRQQRLKIDGYHCQLCGSSKNLEIHHLTYIRTPYFERMKDLITLCHDCHVAVHREKANQKRRKRK